MTDRGSEHNEQAALIQWARTHHRDIPELELLYANVNAQKFGGATKAHKMNTISKLKREGLVNGIPDLCLPIAVHQSPQAVGILYIEMKYGKNTPTQDQEAMMSKLTEQGNTCIVSWSWIDAALVILQHIAMHRMQTHPAADFTSLNNAKDELNKWAEQ